MCSIVSTLCDAMDCSPLGSSVHGIFRARVLEWVAISYSSFTWLFLKRVVFTLLMFKVIIDREGFAVAILLFSVSLIVLLSVFQKL